MVSYIPNAENGDKTTRVARYHRETVKSFFEVIGAAGFQRPAELKPWFVMRRVGAGEVLTFHELYPTLRPGALTLQPTAWAPAGKRTCSRGSSPAARPS